MIVCVSFLPEKLPTSQDYNKNTISNAPENLMPKISINTPAPDFSLVNFLGENIRLSSFNGKANILLVFNRGFT